MTDVIKDTVGLYRGAVTLGNGTVAVRDQAALRSAATDQVAIRAVFGSADEREAARWLLWELGQATGARPASINDLYLARGRGECGGFTVPAINVRVMAYDSARAVFRAAKRIDGGAILLE